MHNFLITNIPHVLYKIHVKKQYKCDDMELSPPPLDTSLYLIGKLIINRTTFNSISLVSAWLSNQHFQWDFNDVLKLLFYLHTLFLAAANFSALLMSAILETKLEISLVINKLFHKVGWSVLAVQKKYWRWQNTMKFHWHLWNNNCNVYRVFCFIVWKHMVLEVILLKLNIYSSLVSL